MTNHVPAAANRVLTAIPVNSSMHHVHSCCATLMNVFIFFVFLHANYLYKGIAISS